MPRRARLRIPGLPLHVVQRGNNRGPCFITDNDRLVYLSLLEEMGVLFDCAIHAHVLMTNHVHVLMTPARAESASLLMKHLGQEYVQYVNRTHGRTGSLWEGRFRSSVVDTDGYLLSCYRYIEMNPVRAGMVDAPGEYLWSSFRTNAWGQGSTLIEPHPTYLALGDSDQARTGAYLALFGQALTESLIEEIRHAVNGGFALGSDEFRDRLSVETGRPVSRRRRRNTTRCGQTALKAE